MKFIKYLHITRIKLGLLAFLFLYLLAAEYSQAQSKPFVYLELVDDPLHSMTVHWINNPGNTNNLEYRERGTSSWESITGSTRNLPNTSLVRYSVNLNNLSPGTSYEFRISGVTNQRFFRTAPDSIEDPIRFVVGGDITETRGDNEQVSKLRDVFEEVSELAARQNPLFVVIGGDYVHTPDDYTDIEEWFYFLQSWSEIMITDEGGYMIPMFGTAGNHEVPNSYGDSPEDAIFFHAFFDYPQEQWGEKRGYGVLDFADYLSIITLDTDHTHSISSQNEWLENTIQDRSDIGHVYPVYHVSGWPVFRSFRGELNEQIRDEWHPIFRDNDVRFVFEHHEHLYKRTYPFECVPPILNRLDCTQTPGGVISLGGGSWGSIIRDVHPNYQSGGGYTNILEVIEEENNFVLMEITQTRRKFQAMSISRGVIDEFEEIFFLPVPEILDGTEITAASFIANWEPVTDADQYRLDVSETSSFSTFVSGYQNINVGNTTSFEVTGLNPGQTYYYRVRARNAPVQSSSSDIEVIETIAANPELSSIEISDEPIEADGMDAGIVEVTIKDDSGNGLADVSVTLDIISGNATVVEDNISTDDTGTAVFEVISESSGKVKIGAIAGATEISDQAELLFIPRSPTMLPASDVKTKSFIANWEVQPEADFYQLDVAKDNNFTDFIDGYESRELGNVTSERVEGVKPGTEYFYRTRAVDGDLVGANSETINVITFPETPIAEEASDRNALQFKANWQPADGADGYLIDVATDKNFEGLLDLYDALEVSNKESFFIKDLDLDNTYYYRVSATAGHRVSEFSNVIEAKTKNINPDQTAITASQLRVLADGNQKNQLQIHLKSDEGTELMDIELEITSDSETTVIENKGLKTDEFGVGVAEVSNSVPEEVTYIFTYKSEPIGEITVEFLLDDSEIELGDNFPNPFSDETFIPVSIPSNMYINLTIYNYLGTPVRTLVDGQKEKGYYEIPFQKRELASGVYFYRLVTDEATITKKMILVN